MSTRSKRYASAERDGNIRFQFGPHKTVSLSATRQQYQNSTALIAKMTAPETNKSI
jgi:hypothetical protein